MVHLFERDKQWQATHDLTFIIDAYVLQEMGYSNNTIRTRYNSAVENFRLGNIDRAIYNLHGDSSTERTVHGFYLNGLVLRIGYEPFRKAFHSYYDDSFKPTYTYSFSGSGQSQVMRRMRENALELLDRIVYFSGQPNILETFPDRGALLERFEVARIPISQQPSSTPPTAQPTQNETRPRWVFVNEEIEVLNRPRSYLGTALHLRLFPQISLAALYRKR
jgi:hypothetical protein